MQIQQQLHYITQHYITLRYNCNYHYIALHDATLQLHYFTLQWTRLHYTIPSYSTQQNTTLITPRHNCNCNCNCNYTNYITLQLQLTTTTQLHYNYTCNY